MNTNLISRFIRLETLLFVLSALSLLCIFLVNFILLKYPSCWKWGYETGQFFSAISYGYLSSYVFYFIVVFRKQESDKINLSIRISKMGMLIILLGHSVFRLLSQSKFEKQKFPPPIIELEKLCKKANIYNAPFSNGNNKITWIELFEIKAKESLTHINQITKLPMVDSKLTNILTRIEDCDLFTYAKPILSRLPNPEPKNLHQFVNRLYEYFNLINELEKYWEENYAIEKHKAIVEKDNW